MLVGYIRPRVPASHSSGNWYSQQIHQRYPSRARDAAFCRRYLHGLWARHLASCTDCPRLYDVWYKWDLEWGYVLLFLYMFLHLMLLPEMSANASTLQCMRTSSLFSKSPRKGEAQTTKPVLDACDTGKDYCHIKCKVKLNSPHLVPVYDSQETPFNYSTDLDDIGMALPLYGSEIPTGSFAVVTYTLSSYKKETERHLNSNVQFVILVRNCVADLWVCRSCIYAAVYSCLTEYEFDFGYAALLIWERKRHFKFCYVSHMCRMCRVW